MFRGSSDDEDTISRGRGTQRGGKRRDGEESGDITRNYDRHLSGATHSRAFQCRIPASTCNRCRSSCHPPAHVAYCNSPVRCAPDVCPTRPGPPGFS